jgi:hypothetical protein
VNEDIESIGIDHGIRSPKLHFWFVSVCRGQHAARRAVGNSLSAVVVLAMPSALHAV